MRDFLVKSAIFVTVTVTFFVSYLLVHASNYSKNERVNNSLTESNLMVLPKNSDFDVLLLGASTSRVLSRSGNHKRLEKELNSKVINLAQGGGQGGPEKNYIYTTYFFKLKNEVKHIVYIIPTPSLFTDYYDNLNMTIEPFNIDFFKHAMLEGMDKRTLFQYARSKFSVNWRSKNYSGYNHKKLNEVSQLAIEKNLENFSRYERISPAKYDEKFSYFIKIAKIAKEKGVKLSFVFPPHLMGKDKYIKKIKKSLEILNKTYKHKVYDFSNSILDPVFFYDHVHLNSRGAEYFTRNFLRSVTQEDKFKVYTPVENQVFQRNQKGFADIPIVGSLPESCQLVEASFNDSPYMKIVEGSIKGEFSGVLKSQKVGQGKLSVRCQDKKILSSVVQVVSIGDIYVIAGQSNASGRALNFQKHQNFPMRASLFGNDYEWRNLKDPVDQSFGQIDLVSEDKSAKGSPWPIVADYLLGKTKIPVAFITTAKGGSRIKQWDQNLSERTLYGSMVKRIKKASNGKVKAILWHQGESDSANGLSEEEYSILLRRLIENLKNDLPNSPKLKLVVAQIGDRSKSTGINLDKIRVAQQNEWINNDNILSGPVLYDIGPLDDGGHFQVDKHIHMLAKRWWASLRSHFYSVKNDEDGRGPILISASHNALKTEVYLSFHDRTLPIKISKAWSGLQIRDGGEVVKVKEVRQKLPNKIVVTLIRAAKKKITVSIGRGIDRAGESLLPVDSSEYNLPAEVVIEMSVGSE